MWQVRELMAKLLAPSSEVDKDAKKSLVFALQSTLFCYSVALPLIGSPEAAFCVSCMAIQQWHAYCKCPSFSSVSAFPWASTSHRGLLGC